MSRRKNYTNRRRKEENFRVEDHVYRQASPLEGTNHFHVKRKLTPRFNNPRRDCYEMKEKTVAS